MGASVTRLAKNWFAFDWRTLCGGFWTTKWTKRTTVLAVSFFDSVCALFFAQFGAIEGDFAFDGWGAFANSTFLASSFCVGPGTAVGTLFFG